MKSKYNSSFRRPRGHPVVVVIAVVVAAEGLTGRRTLQELSTAIIRANITTVISAAPTPKSINK